MQRFCMLLDLVDDPEMIREYEKYHTKVWPEVIQCMTEAGVESMKIYRFGPRLAMILEVNDDFTFEKQAQINNSNDTVREWEALMWKYQQAIPGTPAEQKWVLATEIFDSTDFL